MKKIFVLGGASWDTIVKLDRFPEERPATIFPMESFETVGSTGVGKAIPLKKLGFEVSFHSIIGDDSEGNRIKSRIEAEGIDFLFDIDEQGTEKHTNLMWGNDRISIYTNPPAMNPAVLVEPIISRIEEADIIVLNIINYTRQFIPILKRLGKEVWVDIHDYDGTDPYHRDYVDIADVLFLSTDKMQDYQHFMRQMILSGKRLVIATHGAGGATLMDASLQPTHIPILEGVEVIDTNGAGDNFFAGFLFGHLEGFTNRKSLELATLTAASCVSSREIAASVLNREWLLNEHINQYGV